MFNAGSFQLRIGIDMKQISLTLGSSAPAYASAPCVEVSKDQSDFGGVGPVGRHHGRHLPEVAHGTGRAILPVALSLHPKHVRSQRNSKAVSLRQLPTLVLFPTSTLRRITRDSISVKTAHGVTTSRKWGHDTDEPWMTGSHLEVIWPVSAAYDAALCPVLKSQAT